MKLIKYKKNFQDELISLIYKDPKVYWNLIKGSSVKVKNELQNVNLQCFVNHFKNFNCNDVTNNEG